MDVVCKAEDAGCGPLRGGFYPPGICSPSGRDS